MDATSGIPGTSFHNDCRIIEFKYYKSKDAGIVDHLEEAHLEDAQQVKAYAADMQKAYPHYQIKAYVAYIAGNKACKIFEEKSNNRL